MTDEKKLCPFAFNQLVGNKMGCLEEKCMAWSPALPEDKMKGKSWDALVEYTSLERGYPHDLAETFCRDNAKGRCKLIERQL